MKQAAAEQPRRRDPAPQKKNAAPKQKSAAPKSGLSWMSVDRLEKEIAALTKRIKDLDEQVNDEQVYRDAEKCRKLLSERDETQAELERHEEEWLSRSE